MENSGSHGPLSGWVVAQQHGLTLIGRLIMKECNGDQKPFLSPVYELKPIIQPLPDGMTAMGHTVVPVWLLGVREMPLVESAIAEMCEEFTIEQRQKLRDVIALAEKNQEELRGGGARLIVPPYEIPNIRS